METNQIRCLDDSSKPNDISSKCWVKKGEEYTPIKVVTCKLDGKQYFVLEEIHPDNPVYGGYNVNRFGYTVDDIMEMIEKEQLVEEFV
jgi:hypothetical protein